MTPLNTEEKNDFMTLNCSALLPDDVLKEIKEVIYSMA